MGVPQKIMRAHCAVIRPDHFKFANYGPVAGLPGRPADWLEGYILPT